MRDEALQKARTSRSSTNRLDQLSTQEFIPAVTPSLTAPYWLSPYTDLLDNAVGGHLEVVVAAPPQHGKTVATSHALARWMRQSPGTNFVYATYNQDRSDKVAREFRRIGDAAGLRPSGPLREWRSDATGANVKFTSIGGSLTGYPLDGVLVIDDPLKDESEARSKLVRDNVWDWLFSVALTRMHPGASVICMATRWHPDDPSGRLIREWGFPYVNLQAICEDPETDLLGRELGGALWPEGRPIEYLETRRSRNPNQFAAMYQGDPRPAESKLFQREPSRFNDLPNAPFTVGYGCDLAYTAKTQADRSVVIRAQRFGDDVYLTGGISAQVAATEFTPALKRFVENPSAPVLWYIGGGGEKGVAQFLRQHVSMLRDKPATSDKYVRAQPLAEAWNCGRVHVPSERSPYHGKWVEDLMGEISVFTGVNDPHDDFIDAAASAFDQVSTGVADIEDGLGGVVGSRWAVSSSDPDAWDDDDDDWGDD